MNEGGRFEPFHLGGRVALERRLPGLSRLWEGEVVPLDPQTVIANAEVVFLALPEAASAEMGTLFLAAIIGLIVQAAVILMLLVATGQIG